MYGAADRPDATGTGQDDACRAARMVPDGRHDFVRARLLPPAPRTHLPHGAAPPGESRPGADAGADADAFAAAAVAAAATYGRDDDPERAAWEDASGTRAAWDPPTPQARPTPARRPAAPDPEDERALRFDLEAHVPSLDTVERRARWRPEYDYPCLPARQRFVVFTSLGPDERHDVAASQTGVRLWGMFETMPQAAAHVRNVRAANPHAVWFPLHVVDASWGPIDLPPPRDGHTRRHVLNRELGRIMGQHMEGAVQDTREVQRRRDDTMRLAAERQSRADDHGRPAALRPQRAAVLGRYPVCDEAFDGPVPDATLLRLDYAQMDNHVHDALLASCLPPDAQVTHCRKRLPDGRVVLSRIIRRPAAAVCGA